MIFGSILTLLLISSVVAAQTPLEVSGYLFDKVYTSVLNALDRFTGFSVLVMQGDAPTITCPQSSSSRENPYGPLSCGGSTSGCVYGYDWKYYKIANTAGKTVTVTLTHSGTGCQNNDLYIYDSTGTRLYTSSSNAATVSKTVTPSSDIIVAIDSDSSNNNCGYTLKTSCSGTTTTTYATTTTYRTTTTIPVGGGGGGSCSISYSSRTLPEDVKYCGSTIYDCLHSTDWKFYRIENTAGVPTTVTVTKSGTGCNVNDVYIYDGSTSVYAGTSNGASESWTGTPKNDIVVGIDGDSSNAYCEFKITTQCSGVTTTTIKTTPWIRVRVRDASGNIVETMNLNSGDSKISYATGFVVKPVSFRANQDGYVTHAELNIEKIGLAAHSLNQSISTGDYSFQVDLGSGTYNYPPVVV